MLPSTLGQTLNLQVELLAGLLFRLRDPSEVGRHIIGLAEKGGSSEALIRETIGFENSSVEMLMTAHETLFVDSVSLLYAIGLTPAGLLALYVLDQLSEGRVVTDATVAAEVRHSIAAIGLSSKAVYA